jgi:hypothetical protein
MDPIELKQMINQYGMPMMAAAGMGYFIYFVWKFVTENINSELSEAKKTMIALIDRIRMLDNDLIRLEQKINTAIEMQRGDGMKPHIVPTAPITNEKPAPTSTPQPPPQ